MKSLLAQWRRGLALVEVGRAADACAALAGEPFDLVLLDLALPDSPDPEQTVRTVAAAAGRTPIVAVSMADSHATVTRAVQAGARAFIRKSDSAGVMMATLDMVLAGGSCIPAGSLGESPAPPAQTPALSERQLEVLRLIAKGASNKEIARELEISEATVKVHVHRILQILGAPSRTRAAAWAHQVGLVPVEGGGA